MLLLKSNPVWHGLRSDILKVNQLLEEAHSKSITGFIEFSFSDSQDVALLEKGNILQCIQITPASSKICVISRKDIIHHVETEKAVVGLYNLKEDMLRIIHWIATGDILFENLDSSYTNIKQLLLKLAKENFTGVVNMVSEAGDCYLMLENGSPGYCVCVKGDTAIDSAQCLDGFLNTKPDFSITVYRKRPIADITPRLKEIVREVMGENIPKIEAMLDESGKTKQDLLKTVKEIEKMTFLFFDKKKTEILSRKLKETIEEVIL
ncbi:MAG: hypothetical protein PVF58_20630 [Candidatus Methanofastidiosia archaeon]|jgi:hypothetical protein